MNFNINIVKYDNKSPPHHLTAKLSSDNLEFLLLIYFSSDNANTEIVTNKAARNFQNNLNIQIFRQKYKTLSGMKNDSNQDP